LTDPSFVKKFYIFPGRIWLLWIHHDACSDLALLDTPTLVWCQLGVM
jgi:hypothetical protein